MVTDVTSVTGYLQSIGTDRPRLAITHRPWRQRPTGAGRVTMRPWLGAGTDPPNECPTALMVNCAEMRYFAIPTGSSTRSRIERSSFSGLFTLVEIGHIVIGPAG